MIHRDRTGELLQVEHVINPDDAILLGSAVLGIHSDLHNRRLSNFDTQSYSRSTIEKSLGASDLQFESPAVSGSTFIDDTEKRFTELITSRRGHARGLEIITEFLVGTPTSGWGERWHIDGLNYRMLANISRVAQPLEIADEWDQRQHEPKVPLVLSSHTILTEPGFGIFIDNVCPKNKRIPHAGVRYPDKVFMRLSAIPS